MNPNTAEVRLMKRRALWNAFQQIKRWIAEDPRRHVEIQVDCVCLCEPGVSHCGEGETPWAQVADAFREFDAAVAAERKDREREFEVQDTAADRAPTSYPFPGRY